MKRVFNEVRERPEELVDHFFRHESANLIAVLTRAFGFALIDVVEDMVQEAMLEALHAWRMRGVPDNPAAWLHRVAKNRVIDALRRDGRQSHAGIDDVPHPEIAGRKLSFEADEIQDSLLRMIFACCHPILDRSSQLALTLKNLCGLGDHEIARGLLTTPAAIKKRCTRAKRQLQLNRIALDLPGTELLAERLDAVHDVLYLMFNEGYSSTSGEQPISVDLCEEAARLCHFLCESELCTPTTRALLSLMLFQAARFDSRTGPEGSEILLADQDRSLWDRDMIRVAQIWLQRSAVGTEVSRFHLEAGIARLHCAAASEAQTDWEAIAAHYQMLISLQPSPIYALNYNLAISRLGRVREALGSLQALEQSKQLANYPLLQCAIADLLGLDGQTAAALEHWQLALQQTSTPSGQAIIRHRISELEALLASEA